MSRKFVSFRFPSGVKCFGDFEVLICMNSESAKIETYTDPLTNSHHFIFSSHGVRHDIAMADDLLSRRVHSPWFSSTPRRALKELRKLGPFKPFNGWNYQIETARGVIFP